MDERMLTGVRRKFVQLMRSDPPPRVAGPSREPLAPVFDRWVAKRFEPEEVATLFRFETTYGERALSDWFAEVVLEAGLPATPRRRA